jgi:hypothetical protein
MGHAVDPSKVFAHLMLWLQRSFVSIALSLTASGCGKGQLSALLLAPMKLHFPALFSLVIRTVRTHKDGDSCVPDDDLATSKYMVLGWIEKAR